MLYPRFFPKYKSCIKPILKQSVSHGTLKLKRSAHYVQHISTLVTQLWLIKKKDNKCKLNQATFRNTSSLTGEWDNR